MIYDQTIQIATANTRYGPWQNQTLLLSEFYAKLATPARGSEIRAAYLALPKREQDKRKDVGGFVGGTLTGAVRKNGQVAARCLVTLDIDKVEAGGTQRILAALEGLGCGYAVYSTRKHAPEAPRLRAILPLASPLNADEYEPCARLLAQYIDPMMQCFDRTTFEPTRLMYWPSCCADAEYICQTADKPPVDGRALLGAAPDWREVAAWPRCPDEMATERHAAAKQSDPETKEGMVGTFCRVYDIPKALDAFLPGIYLPCDASTDRLTFAGGSTSGGAVLYENGKFLYSHHATDPAGGHLCNAFDLVRLHRFGTMDADAKPGTPPARLPSYAAMCKLAAADPAVAAQFDADSAQRIRSEFAGVLAAQQQTPSTAPQSCAADASPALQFRVSRNDAGKPEPTIDNAWAILETDPMLQGRIMLDVFRGRGIAQGPYPWNADARRRFWTDNDDVGAQWYLEKMHRYTNKGNVIAALSLCGQYHATDPVREYLESLKWDGVARLDTMFIDYLGAQDNAYTRAVTRKALVAAVARTFVPGIKFDCMTILTGRTGIGKSTVLRKLGRDWFNDSLQSFEGKDSRELIQGAWIVEVAELGYMSKTETNQIKQFLSQQDDIFRAAYGKNTENHPRRCVFFGTSNDYDYLKDRTGNRRFWPLDVGVCAPKSNVFTELTAAVVDQIWAEAVAWYRLGETLYLSGEAEKTAVWVQEDHTEQSPGDGVVQEYLNQMVPENWLKMSAEQVAAWNSGVMQAATGAVLIPRPAVCAAEIWEQVYHQNLSRMRQSDARAINQAIEKAGGWKKKRLRFQKYGMQRGYIRE